MRIKQFIAIGLVAIIGFAAVSEGAKVTNKGNLLVKVYKTYYVATVKDQL